MLTRCVSRWTVTPCTQQSVQATKGRIQAFQQLRDALEAELMRTQ